MTSTFPTSRRARLQRRLHREGRPHERGHPAAGQGAQGPLGRDLDRRSRGEHADGKSILTCIAIRNICPKREAAQHRRRVPNPDNRHHLKKAGADEIISSDELGLRLPGAPRSFHGMTRVYQELLTVGRDANEMYLLRRPEGLVGRIRRYRSMFTRLSRRQNIVLLLGIQRGEEMMLNPIGRGRAAASRRSVDLAEPGLPRPDAALANRPTDERPEIMKLTENDIMDAKRRKISAKMTPY